MKEKLYHFIELSMISMPVDVIGTFWREVKGEMYGIVRVG